MELINKTIIIISPEPWSHIHVSKHHFAKRLLERGNKVCFLNPPTTSWTLREVNRLLVVNYPKFPRGLRFYPPLIQRYFMKKYFSNIEDLIGQKIDVVWTFDNSVFFDLSFLDDSVTKICHIVDLNQDFQLKKAAITSDICLGTSRYIVEKLKRYNSKSFFLHHGVQDNLNHLDEIVLPGKNKVKALYIGNLSMKYLDWEVLFKAAKFSQHVDVVLIGPNAEELDPKINETHVFKQKVLCLENVYTLPRIGSDDIMNYMVSSDFLLVAYREKHHVDQSNPHKMMEYLKSGKPILCTYTEEYAGLRDVIFMTQENDNWPKAFADMVDNLSYWNDSRRVERRISFAQQHTYEEQIIKVENYLKKI